MHVRRTTCIVTSGSGEPRRVYGLKAQCIRSWPSGPGFDFRFSRKWVLFHMAFKYHPPIVLIWLMALLSSSLCPPIQSFYSCLVVSVSKFISIVFVFIYQVSLLLS